MLSADDVKILETAEYLEGHPRTNAPAIVRARTGLPIARYAQILLHLVIQPDVLRDPRWTMLAYRIQEQAHGGLVRRQGYRIAQAS